MPALRRCLSLLPGLALLLMLSAAPAAGAGPAGAPRVAGQDMAVGLLVFTSDTEAEDEVQDGGSDLDEDGGEDEEGLEDEGEEDGDEEPGEGEDGEEGDGLAEDEVPDAGASDPGEFVPPDLTACDGFANHGACVSNAARFICPPGPLHGVCVSAYAHLKRSTLPEPDDTVEEPLPDEGDGLEADDGADVDGADVKGGTKSVKGGTKSVRGGHGRPDHAGAKAGVRGDGRGDQGGRSSHSLGAGRGHR